MRAAHPGLQPAHRLLSIKNTRIPGFVGSAVVEARLALPLLELWNALLSFAPYGGIGIKTTLGMGGVSVEPLVLPQRSL